MCRRGPCFKRGFEELVTKIRTREQDLERQALKQSFHNKRNRKFKQSDEKDKDVDSFVPGNGRNNKPESSKDKGEKYNPFPSFHHSYRKALIPHEKEYGEMEEDV